MENIEPLVLLQAKSKDLLKIIQKPDIQYVESQFLTSDREYLKKENLSIDDIYFLDRFYMLTCALPYYKTIGLARKKLQMKIKTNVDDNLSLATGTLTKTEEKCEFQSEQEVSKKDSLVISAMAHGMDNNIINLPNSFKCGSKENINGAIDYQNRSLILKCTRSGSGPQKIHLANQENGFKNDISNAHYNGNSNIESSKLTRDTTTNLEDINADISSTNEGSISSSSEKTNTHIEVKTNELLAKNLNVLDKFRGQPQHNVSSVPSVSDQTNNNSSLHEKEIYDVIFGDKLQLSTIHLVIKKSDVSSLEAISSQLKQETMKSWSSESGEKKVVVVNDKYYRGIILPNNNTEEKEDFSIKLVDLGWFIPFNSCQQSKLMVLPEKYKSKKPLAFAIHIGNEDIIPRNTHATIEEIGMINEKIKSVRVKKIHPVQSDNIFFNVTIPEPTIAHKPSPNIQDKSPVNLTTPEPAIAHKPSANIQDKSLELNSPLRVTYIERQENSKENHWVQDAKYSDYYVEWQSLGEKYTKNLDKMPLLGDFCLKMTEGDWGRIKVVALEPLTIFHIDFGSTEVVSTFTDLKPLPEEMFSIEPLAYRIKFYSSSDNVAYNFCDVFDIIPIEYSNSVYIVLKNKEELSVIEDTLKRVTPEEVGNKVGLQNEISQAKVESTPTTHKPLTDYSYKKAAINQQNIDLNKQIKVTFMQYDDSNASHCWVQEDASLSSEILLRWDEIMKNYKEPFNINTLKPGDFCVKLYEELWCRAKIMSCNPFTLFYVDYGNTEINVDMSQIKPLIEELSHFQPLAMKIEFYYDKSKVPMEYGDTFSITPIQIKADLYVVLKDDEKVEHQLTTTPILALTSSKNLVETSAIFQNTPLELNKLSQVVFVENDIDNPKFKWVQDILFYDLFEAWYEICITQEAQFVEKPKVGELCIYLSEGIWYRAKIVKLSPLTVFLIDYGNQSVVQNVADIKPLPEELSTVKPLAYKIQFLHKASASKTYEVEEEFGITPIEIRDDVFLVLKDDEVASIQSYIYQYPAPALVLNKSVQLCWLQEDEFDPQYTWVSDFSCEESVTFVTLMEESTNKYIHKPQLYELCCKEYDDMWCRTIVVGLDPLTVFYIDYGNVEEVSLDQLKPLPPQAAKYPGFAFRVIFVNNKPVHEFGSTVSLTPVSFDDNVYTVTE